MLSNSSFQVYNASAGSGKTFTLVKEYLKILFSASGNYQFKNILAITFTNKAVAEMKARILEMLKDFSQTKNLEHSHPMFVEIIKELEIKPSVLKKKANVPTFIVICFFNSKVHQYFCEFFIGSSFSY